jgi:xanthine dehydrogenase accessory factor
MFDVAEDVAKWRAEGKTVHVAQVVATRGFSSRDPAAALAWTDDGEVAGALVPGLPTDVGVFGTDADGRLVETTVSDDAAVAAGLSCGGVARVFVQDAMAFPAEVWERLAQREPLCLVHEIVDGGSGSTAVYTPAIVRSAAAVAADIPRLFARGASATALLTEGEATVAVVALWPPTTLVVVGDGKIADALAAVGVVLGWDVTVTNEAAAAAGAAAALTESDAIVVLSHDRAVDVPALAAVLGGRAGYVGALGSRGTQAARRRARRARRQRRAVGAHPRTRRARHRRAHAGRDRRVDRRGGRCGAVRYVRWLDQPTRRSGAHRRRARPTPALLAPHRPVP